MRRHFWFSTAVAGFSAACVFVSNPARGQESVAGADTQPDRISPDEIKIFQVQNDVATMANTLAYLAEGTRVQVVTDPGSNSIIVRGPAASLETMEAVVQQLDKPIRQVEIRLLVAELPGSVDATPTFDADFEVAVSQALKLQADGDATVLKRMQLTSLERKPSTVQVGQTEATVSGQMVVSQFRAQRTYQMQNVGTLLEVTPRISAGKVLLDLNFEMSRLAPTKPIDDNPDEFTPPPAHVTATLKSSLAVPNSKTVTVTDFSSSAAPDDARMIMLISARVVE